MLHDYTYCDYTTNFKPNLRRHGQIKHEQNRDAIQNNRAPTTMYVG